MTGVYGCLHELKNPGTEWRGSNVTDNSELKNEPVYWLLRSSHNEQFELFKAVDFPSCSGNGEYKYFPFKLSCF